MDMFGKKVGKEERASLEIAEASRQTEWKSGSFLRGLYEGKFLWNLVYPFPEQTPEDKKKGDEYLAAIEKLLCEKLDPEQVDLTGEIPAEVVRKLFEIGAFALKIPESYGGLGLSKVNYGRVMHLISSYCSSTAVLLSAHQSIGVPQPLLDFGTEEQKKKFLPRFRKDVISGFALTEPGAGSDPSKMTTTATPVEGGKYFLLNGEKLWCTNGVIADILIVMALTPPKMVHGKEKKQITAFIVETNTPGFEVKHRCEFMGIRGAKIGLLKFTNVKVPRENIVAGEGEGLKLALTTLNTGRLTMPAAVTGACKYALRVSRIWAAKRVQWGSPIGEHEAIADKLASMSASVLAMEAMTWYVTHTAMRTHADIRLEAAVAKKFCTEMCWHVTNEALQVRGGRGYETSKSLRERGEGETAYPIERLVRDSRINTIIEGTSEIMNLFITREALDIHLKRMLPLFNPKAGLFAKLKAVFEMSISYAFWYPGLWLPVFGFGNSEGIPSKLKPHLLYAKRMTQRLARSMFHSMMIYQQAMAKKESLAARFVEIGCDLFAISVVCSYAASKIKDGTAREDLTLLADLFCRTTRTRIARRFHEVCYNQDGLKKAVAKKVLSGQYEWLESDIIK
ncbi:MAG: acyl-CoA dehydrogenase family protein [Candidatus Omnitrophota bacterium]